MQRECSPPSAWHPDKGEKNQSHRGAMEYNNGKRVYMGKNEVGYVPSQWPYKVRKLANDRSLELKFDTPVPQRESCRQYCSLPC